MCVCGGLGAILDVRRAGQRHSSPQGGVCTAGLPTRPRARVVVLAPGRMQRPDAGPPPRPTAPNRAAHACKGAPGGQLKGARLVFAACPRDCCSAASALLQPSAPLQAQLLRSTGGGCGRTQARAGRQGPRVPFLGLREKQMLHGQDECCQAVCLVCLQQAEDGTGTAVLSTEHSCRVRPRAEHRSP